VTYANLPIGDAGSVLPNADAVVVRAEVDAILADPRFVHSKRCQAFLRYVVEQTLTGHRTELKERTVGVEALGRPASYDTGQDPVVRTTAAEVRKRLAQYYQQRPEAPIRIVLPTGSYVPSVERATLSEVASQPSPLDLRGRVGFNHRDALGAAAALILVGAIAVALLLAAPESSPLELFWKPIIEGNGTTKVFIGPATQAGVPPSVITMDAAGTLSRVTALMQERGKAFEIKEARQGAFADLRTHPAVTIGLFNNRWTRRATESLRFRPVNTEDGRLQITDTAHADTPKWARRFGVPGTHDSVVEDFALVSRVLDAQSGHWVIALGGIGTHGTAAAGEFVTSRDHLQGFVARAPADWPAMNVQIVLSTNVHDGVAGPPRIVTSHVWR
jgi:hypothetical protein